MNVQAIISYLTSSGVRYDYVLLRFATICYDLLRFCSNLGLLRAHFWTSENKH